MRNRLLPWIARLPFRRLAAFASVVALAAGLITAGVVASSPSRAPLPVQQTGTAAGSPHRVSAAVTSGRVVDGKLVHATASQRVTGHASKAWLARVPGAVPPATPPKPLHFPVQGKPAETARVVAAPKRKAVTGYDAKTSRQLRLTRADQVTYANADGTRTTFDYAEPVNYRRSGGTWAPISTALIPDGQPSAGSPTETTSPSPGSPDATPGAASASATAVPSPSAGPSLSTAPPEAGWTERSEALPESFAPYASDAGLVSMPLGAGESVAFGVAGAAAVPGTATGGTVSYASALPDSTIEFTAGTGLVKEQIILASPDAPTTWVFPLTLTGLRARLGSGGLIEFTDPAGKIVAYIPHGFMADSRIDPHSGDGATSYGVAYSLVTRDGQQAIRMTLDASWLRSSARVFPVTVDPSVDAINADATMYVQDGSENSVDNEIHVGTWDGGTDTAESYLSFGSMASTLQNDTVLGARLNLFNTWSYSCSARPVNVYPITSSWSVDNGQSGSGPSTGAAVGSASFATGWVPEGSTTSPCPAAWKPFPLNQAATNLINGWTHGTVADDGLAVGASTSDSYAWKKFASDETGTGDPFLAITWTADGASYSLASRTPITPVEPGQNGVFAIKVKNTGSVTWTQSNGYKLSYRVYDSTGTLVTSPAPVFTAMPSSVAPGQTVTVDATVAGLPDGASGQSGAAYTLDFDMYSGATAFSSEGIAPYAVGLYVPKPPPTITGVYPPTGFISTTLQQQLSVAALASSSSGTVTYSFTLTCKPLPGQTCVDSQPVTVTGLTEPYWTPPAVDLQWDTPYVWSATASDGSITTVSDVSIIMEPLQPPLTSNLGESSGQAYDPLTGDYTTSATDAAVGGAGIPLEIDRTYNSMDPRTTGAFGAGWSSAVDSAVRPATDGAGGVIVTVPSGKQLRFEQNDPSDAYQVAFQANTNDLYGFTDVGTKLSTTLGMEAGTSPSSVALSDATFMSAFQANDNVLYLYKWAAGTDISTTLGMDPGTDPALGALPSGAAWVAAFQANNHDLYIYTSAGTETNTGLGMQPGTSPSIAVQPGGEWTVAFQANTGTLHTYAFDGSTSATTDGMDTTASPSIIALSGGSYEIAFEANNDFLSTFHTGGTTDNTTFGMEAGTSPSIAIQGDGLWAVAFQSNNNYVSVYTPNGDIDVTPDAMQAGTSPSIAPEAGGSFEVAFENSGDFLSLLYTGGFSRTTTLGMAAGTSPSLAIAAPTSTASSTGAATYSPPFGSSDILVHNIDGIWTLRDSADTNYMFNAAGVISKITDPNGQALRFAANSAGQVTTITSTVSGRTLALAWTATSPAHVATVTTQPPASGQAGYTWTYNYSGNDLASVCGPGETCSSCPSGCTSYSYSSGSDYLPSVLDSAPRDYWQLGESSGATTATDEVDDNLGTTSGTYHNVTLGVSGPLAGSSETAASFNGTSAYVSLPANLIDESTDVSIELWFKAASSTSSGVLFSYDADPIGTASGSHQPALYIGGNGELYGEFWNGSVDPIHTTTSVDDGKWHHVVLSASSGSQAMHLDGSLVGTLPGQIDQRNMGVDTIGTGYWTSWPENTAVGSTTSTVWGYFGGDIGQVAVYNDPVGSGAVAAHYSLATTASTQLSQVTLPSGNAYEVAAYDTATDRISSYTDPYGGLWSISQPLTTGYKSSSDGLSWVTRDVTVTDPAGRHEVYTYDMLDGGRLIDYSNGADAPIAYSYDAAGFLNAVSDQNKNLVCFTNDINGNVLTRSWYPPGAGAGVGGGIGTTAACGGTTSSTPTCPGTLTTTSTTPCTTFYGYDTTDDQSQPLNPANNELIWESDARSASDTDTTYRTTYAYNSLGQLTSSTTPDTTAAPNGRTTSYAYTAGTETAYGGSGTEPPDLLASATTPGGATTSYQYYSDGDLAQVTEPSGRGTVYTYDTLGRPLTSTVTTTSYPSGETTSYTYTPSNQLATVTYPGIVNPVTEATHKLQDTYAYDSDDNLLSLTTSDLTGGDSSRTVSYTYDNHDQVATQTEPAGATSGGTGQTGGASSANPGGATTAYDYDEFGNVSAKTDPNGNVYRYSYNEYQEATLVELYTSSTSASSQTASCTAPAIQDGDGGCDLVLDSSAYDAAGRLASTTDAMGRTTSYTYNPDQELTSAETTDPTTSPTTSRLTGYSYDAAGNMTGTSVTALSGSTTGASTVTDYTYDADNLRTSEVSDAGSASGDLNRTVAYTYDLDRHVTSQTVGTTAQGGPSVTDQTYDTAGDQLSQTVVDGSTNLTTSWTYDQNGLPLSMTTPDGNASGATAANYTTNYSYDPDGNLSTVTGPPVQTQAYSAQAPTSTRPVTTYGYDSYDEQTQVEDPDGNVTTTGYDGDGRVASVQQPSYTPPGASSPVNGTTSYAYDEDGNLAQVTDPAGNVTSYTHDPLGDVTSVTEPQLPGQSAPGVWNYTYDANGEQTSAQDPLGNTSHATYNYFGETATATDAMGNTTSYAYNYLGDPTKVTTPDGSVTTSTYDHLGELTATADAYGDTSSFSYNYAGLPTVSTNPDGSYTQDGYDEAGNLTSITDYGVPVSGTAPKLRSESLGYDPSGNQTSVTDWNGNTTSDGYNAAGELTSQVVPVTSSSSSTTGYGYDPAGNQTSVTSGNGNTTWTSYNAWNLPESVIEPTTATQTSAADTTWTTGYDADGRPVSVSQPGGITQAYAYDPLGDLTSKSGAGASAPTTAQTLGYDLDGRLTSASAPGGTDAFTYNADSELTGTSGPSGTSGYTYNGDGLVSSETSPAGTTSYTYDSADRLSTEAEPLTGSTLTWAYNADSQPTSTSYSVGGASGPQQAFTYDSLDRLASDTLTSASGSVLASEAYGYDNNDNLTSQTTAGLAGAGTATYAYDKDNRLTSQTSGGTTTPYAYDADGNLTQDGGTSYAYNAQDQVTSSTTAAGTTAYSYTQSGALSSITPPTGSAETFTYDALGELISAPAGVSYAYDALGRLVTRASGSSTSSISYLGTGDSIASDGTDAYSYTPSGTVTAAQASGGTGYATMSDVHGDLTGTFSPTSAASALAGSAAYSPYGSVTATSGFEPTIGYQGGDTDPSTGLVDMNARWYSPGTGSFITNDTIAGSPLSSTVDGNPYAYTAGDPLTETDPTGHSVWNDVENDVDEDADQIGQFADAAYNSVAEPMLPDMLGAVEDYPELGLLEDTGGFAPEMIAVGSYLARGMNDFVDQLELQGYDSDGPAYNPASGSSSAPAESGGNLLYPWQDTATLLPPSVGGSTGLCATGCYPPPPPPPPQDCYAGPHATCAPPDAPESLRTAEHITAQVHDTTNFRKACKTSGCYIEKLPKPKPIKIKGTTPNAKINPNLNDTITVDLSQYIQTNGQINEPTDPNVPLPSGSVTPVNGGDVHETASGGNFKDGGGGTPPPTSNGACEEPDGNQPIAESGTISARSVRFSQNSIAQEFQNGQGSVLQQAAEWARNGEPPDDLPPIRLFERDGNLFSLDNRRLFTGQMANVDLSYRMATQSEINKELNGPKSKFTTANEGTGIEMRGVGYFSWCDQ